MAAPKTRKNTSGVKTQAAAPWAAFKDYALGLVLGVGGLTLCFASIEGRVTDDRALYENLTEIRVSKQKDLSFDGDIAALNRAEARFREGSLPRAQKKARASAKRVKPNAGARQSQHGRLRGKNPRRATAAQWNGNASGRS